MKLLLPFITVTLYFYLPFLKLVIFFLNLIRILVAKIVNFRCQCACVNFCYTHGSGAFAASTDL